MSSDETAQATYTFDELVEKAGLPSRTVRSYFEQKLLRGPETKGRYATYGAYHLQRLLAIRALKEQRGLSTGEIRQELLRLTDEQVRALAETAHEQTPGPRTGGRLAAFFEQREAQYLGASRPAASLAAAGMPAVSTSRRPPAKPEPRTSPPVEHLLEQLQALLGRRQPSVRRSAPDMWYRIPITADIELTVRGPKPPEELDQFERIAAYLREVLLGGVSGPAP